MIQCLFKVEPEIAFIHFKPTENEIQLSQQIRRIKDFDGSVFIHSQLENIREKLLAEKIHHVVSYHLEDALMKKSSRVPGGFYYTNGSTRATKWLFVCCLNIAS